MPKGGGAIKGIDEKFSVNAANGTASFSIPLPFAAARGVAPALTLSYNSGSGNGVFGLGWNPGLPSIKRKSDKGLPQYFDNIDSDIFLFSETEDLVPEFKKQWANNKWEFELEDGQYVLNEKASSDGLYTIRCFIPRIEGLFARIERWMKNETGIIKWRVITKQMEKAYMDQNRREYEITKHISIAQLDPVALIRLRETGICDFEIPEALYDMDHPGHYFRRIRSASVSIPCIAGPYTSVSTRLSLIKNQYRYNTKEPNNYKEVKDAQGNGNDIARFIYTKGAIQSIATSHAQNDSGMFELNFRDERYLPFEYAGAISSRRLELPTEVKQFDHNTISEVIIHLKYTAREGGVALKTEANKVLKSQLEAVKQGLNQTGMHVALQMKHDLPNEWNLMKKIGTIDLILNKTRLPYMVQIDTAKIESVMLVAKINNNPGELTLKVNGTDTKLTRDKELQLHKSSALTVISINKPFSLSILDADKQNLDELFMVVKYKF